MSATMITATQTAIRCHITLPRGLLNRLERALKASAAPAVQGLERGATTWLARPLGRTVTCKTGTLWLTFDGEPQDVILEAGQSHHCAKTARLGIHAMTAAAVIVD